MATFKEKKVTKAFHLSLEEYKKLFPEFKARGRNLIVVALNPVTNLSGIILNQSNTEDEKNKVIQRLTSLGLMIISKGKEITDLKEGELVFMSNRGAVSYAVKRSIIINDVFPRVREYTMMIFAEHNVEALIDIDPTILTEIEQNVNVSMEETNYQNEIKAIKERQVQIN